MTDSPSKQTGNDSPTMLTMSTMTIQLLALRPDWPGIPIELDRAWSHLEELGLGTMSPTGYIIDPYPDSDAAGPYFSANLSLEGWFHEDSVAYTRVLPIAEAAGEGSLIALWLDDDKNARVILLESEGSGFLIANDASELLVLFSIGYAELLSHTLGSSPIEPISPEALEPLRSWVESEFAMTIPDSWPAPGCGEFSAWLDRELGREEPTSLDVPDSSTETPMNEAP